SAPVGGAGRGRLAQAAVHGRAPSVGDSGPMERPNASAFSQELLDLFDRYVHGSIDRREFLAQAARFAVGGMTAAAILEALSPRFAEAQQIARDDKRLSARYVEFDSPQGSGKVRGYLVRPADAKGKLPAVLVVHENRG